MKRLFGYIKPYLAWTLIAPLFMMGEVVMDLLQPELMSSVINDGVIPGDRTYIILTCLKMVGVAILGIIGGCGNMFFSTKAGYAFARDLRSDLYSKVQSFSFANIDKFKTGSLVTRLTNDVTQIQNAFTSIIRMLVRSPLLFVGGVIQVFRISPRLALIVLIAMPLIGIMIGIVMKFGFPMFRIVQKKLDKTNVVMQENLAGV
ncbi:MAG: ABC transporter ATP-binding protein, partial [Oscillospiraceae bacterium]|nr:ABC transporter ATP-binding protein [Oscillospiraceae bacterium]